MKDELKPLPHDDSQAFRDAVIFTATETTFNPYQIEKDYYCSLVLQAIQTEIPRLFFKGGTLLSKVYTGFNRLSEDLDFTVPLPLAAKRSERSNAVGPFKELFSELPSKIQGIQVSRPLKGSNNSVQYNGELVYHSCIENRDDRVLFEIGLR